MGSSTARTGQIPLKCASPSHSSACVPFSVFCTRASSLPSTPAQGHHAPPAHTMTINDLFLKDAFLVFRSMCKLTMKPLSSKSERDLKSHAMCSKLLSLYTVLVILNAHMDVFVLPSSLIHSSSSHEATPFVQMANQYLCLSLSRKAASPVLQAFEISVEIFWRVITGLRTKLKVHMRKEIEVPFHEIFFPILEMKTSTLKQKAAILGMLSRLCHDPQALVEIYLNYNCDSQVADNIYEHLMNIITKIGTSMLPSAAQQKPADPASPALTPTSKVHAPGIPPSLVTSAVAVSGSLDTSALGHSEQQLCRQSLECLTAVLRSLVAWGTTPDSALAAAAASAWRTSVGEDGCPEGLTPDASQSLDRLPTGGPSAEATRQPTPGIHDDPGRFESAKQKKTMLLEGVKKFNLKPKRTGFILSKAPQDVTRFLLHTDGLSKSMIGEYLGEGRTSRPCTRSSTCSTCGACPSSTRCTSTCRRSACPGKRRRSIGSCSSSPSATSRAMRTHRSRTPMRVPRAAHPRARLTRHGPVPVADTAYVISYSVILLNTDAHNPQVKKRMTRADFVKNTRGINEGADLPEELLSAIFDDIVNNGIRIKDEVDSSLVASLAPGAGLASALATVGQDLQREAYMLQSNGMANKTEETDNLDVVELCLDGFRNAIRIVCFFDLELERNAFVTTLAKFTFLNNLGEMKTKNMEAAQMLLDVTVMEGNNLKGSWREVLSCVSQLEHMQLISSGVDVLDARKGYVTRAPIVFAWTRVDFKLCSTRTRRLVIITMTDPCSCTCAARVYHERLYACANLGMAYYFLSFKLSHHVSFVCKFRHSYLAAFQVSTRSVGLARSHGALYVVSNTTAQATRYFSRRSSSSLQEPFAFKLSMPSVSQECLNALASRVKSSLKLSRTLKVQQAAAQSTISMLKSKVSSLGSLAQASQTVSPPRSCACPTPLLPSRPARASNLTLDPACARSVLFSTRIHLPATQSYMRRGRPRVTKACTYRSDPFCLPLVRPATLRRPRSLTPSPFAHLIPSIANSAFVPMRERATPRRHAPAFACYPPHTCPPPNALDPFHPLSSRIRLRLRPRSDPDPLPHDSSSSRTRARTTSRRPLDHSSLVLDRCRNHRHTRPRARLTPHPLILVALVLSSLRTLDLTFVNSPILDLT
ncbi:hypothetical protein HETIRDRAFT_391221 [Heterobasidion irregulare TC 32-1]|uniref:SEC7 domain-containing protein n=2 Tax=Heterobasidion irregulare (strain TC 32-1) TaxID=747525 RepID=W4JRT8_HETIT|nr:uncharacterized protein HETIRDRAFT_391221 [Heterobasidion irregulare TC 32-1]ETW75591.1 hypothetical protein HETIRDRAFT_391221 [Heterobasidion irregulare TC 32-1]